MLTPKKGKKKSILHPLVYTLRVTHLTREIDDDFCAEAQTRVPFSRTRFARTWRGHVELWRRALHFPPTKGMRSKEIKNSVFDFPSLTRGSRFRWRIAGGNEEEERMSRALDKLSSLKSWSANVSSPLLFVEEAISSPVSLILEMPAIYFVWTDSCVTVARLFHFLPLMLLRKRSP